MRGHVASESSRGSGPTAADAQANDAGRVISNLDPWTVAGRVALRPRAVERSNDEAIISTEPLGDVMVLEKMGPTAGCSPRQFVLEGEDL